MQKKLVGGLGSITSVHGSGCTEFVHNITIQIVTILFKTNSDSLYYTSASAQFVLRKYLGLPLLSNSKFSKFKSPRFCSSCFLRNSNLGKTKLVCVVHLLEELKTSNSNSKLKRNKVANHLV